MSRVRKTRFWDAQDKEWNPDWMAINGDRMVADDGRELIEPADPSRFIPSDFTGLKDKNGVEIYEGDILQFSDKWEWYRIKYGPAMYFASEERRAALRIEFDAEPEERRVVEMPSVYEWLLSSDQHEWEVIGNIHQNPELLEAK